MYHRSARLPPPKSSAKVCRQPGRSPRGIAGPEGPTGDTDVLGNPAGLGLFAAGAEAVLALAATAVGAVGTGRTMILNTTPSTPSTSTVVAMVPMTRPIGFRCGAGGSGCGGWTGGTSRLL